MTSIWSYGIFVTSLTDYMMFGLKLGLHHIVGMLFITACVVLLQFRPTPPPVIDESESRLVEPIPLYVPVLFALFTPLFFNT